MNPKPIYQPYNFNNQEILKALLYKVANDPTGINLVSGLHWLNTTSNIWKYYDGTVVHEILDIDSLQTLTNKTIDASDNTISNIDLSMFASGVVVTTDPTGASTDNEVLTAKAVYDFVSSVVSSFGKLVGDFDASSGSIPTTGSGEAGAIMKGDYWRISVAGTISGLTPESNLQVGDIITAKVDGANTSAQFFSLQANLTSATETVEGTVMLATEDETHSGSGSKTPIASHFANHIRVFQFTFNNTTDWATSGDYFTITKTGVNHGFGFVLGAEIFDSTYDKVDVGINISQETIVLSSSVKFTGKAVIFGKGVNGN